MGVFPSELISPVPFLAGFNVYTVLLHSICHIPRVRHIDEGREERQKGKEEDRITEQNNSSGILLKKSNGWVHHSSWGSKARYSCRVGPSWEPWFVTGMKCYWHFWQWSNELMASLSHFLLNSRTTCIYNHGGYIIGMIILLYSWTTGTEHLRIPRIFCIKIILCLWIAFIVNLLVHGCFFSLSTSTIAWIFQQSVLAFSEHCWQNL